MEIKAATLVLTHVPLVGLALQNDHPDPPMAAATSSKGRDKSEG
jgi:hypothetical protein